MNSSGECRCTPSDDPSCSLARPCYKAGKLCTATYFRQSPVETCTTCCWMLTRKMRYKRPFVDYTRDAGTGKRVKEKFTFMWKDFLWKMLWPCFNEFTNLELIYSIPLTEITCYGFRIRIWGDTCGEDCEFVNEALRVSGVSFIYALFTIFAWAFGLSGICALCKSMCRSENTDQVRNRNRVSGGRPNWDSPLKFETVVIFIDCDFLKYFSRNIFSSPKNWINHWNIWRRKNSSQKFKKFTNKKVALINLSGLPRLGRLPDIYRL
jgi:hypothetical protein